MYRRNQAKAMVRQMRTGSDVLLLLEHGLLRLPVSTVTLVDSHANVFPAAHVYQPRRQFGCKFERAAGDAQTRVKRTSSDLERTEGLEWIGVSPGDSNRKFDNSRIL